MYLISCIECGVVLDKSKIPTLDMYNEDNTINTDNAVWEDRQYYPIIYCPICNSKIVIKGEQQ